MAAGQPEGGVERRTERSRRKGVLLAVEPVPQIIWGKPGDAGEEGAGPLVEGGCDSQAAQCMRKLRGSRKGPRHCG